MFWHDFGKEGGGAMVTMFPRGAWYLVALSLLHLINSLTAIGGPDRQLFFELRARVVSPQIFVRSQSLIAR